MTLKPETTSGQEEETSFFVITFNLNFTCTSHKNHSQLHWSIWTWPGQRTQVWMYCRKNVSTIVGTSIWIDFLSESWKGFSKFTFSKEKPLQGFLCSGERPTKIQASIGLNYLLLEIWIGVSRAAHKKSNNGRWRNQSSTMLASWEAFFFSIRTMKSMKRSLKSARKIESSKRGGRALYGWDQKARKDATENYRLGAQTSIRKQSMLVLLKLMWPQSVWNLLFQEIMWITSLIRSSIQ